MLKKLLNQVKKLLAGEDAAFPQQVHKPQKAKREYVTLFRASWDVLRERRKEAGLLVSGETRRVLRAHLKRRLSKVKV